MTSGALSAMMSTTRFFRFDHEFRMSRMVLVRMLNVIAFTTLGWVDWKLTFVDANLLFSAQPEKVSAAANKRHNLLIFVSLFNIFLPYVLNFGCFICLL